MQNDIDSKFLLRVFGKITAKGKKTEEGHLLEGVIAYSDFDGYTAFLKDAKVQLSVGFHNTYHFDYQSKSDFDDFEQKLRSIDKRF